MEQVRSLGVDELFVFVSVEANERHLQQRAALAEVAEEEGLDVSWVLGDPSWAAPGGELLAARALEKLAHLQVKLGAPVGAPGRRVQFDVEPYLLPDWEADRSRVIDRYVTVIAQLAAGSRMLGLEPWLVIPFWFDGIEKNGRPLHELVTDLSDGVVVMAYMNRSPKVLEVSRVEAEYVARVGGRLVVAVETKCIEPAHNSYCTRGGGALEADLDEIERALATSPAFEGVAIHDFEAFRSLVVASPD